MNEIPPSFVVTKTPIWIYVGYFITYVILHILIGKILERKKMELVGQENNEALKTEIKYWTIGFKWFPAAYLVFVILMLW